MIMNFIFKVENSCWLHGPLSDHKNISSQKFNPKQNEKCSPSHYSPQLNPKSKLQTGFGRKWPQTSVFILRRSCYPQPPPPLPNAPNPPPPSYPCSPNPSSTSQNPRGPNPSSKSSLRPPPEQPSPLHSSATTASPRSQSPTSETSASSPTSTTASPLWQTSS